MKNLINFINNIRFLLFFLILQFIAFLFISNSSGYQKTAILNSATNFSGWFYTKEKNIKDYFALNKINEKLHQENALLKQKAFRNYQIVSENLIKVDNIHYQLQFDYQPAEVIRNSTSSRYNVLTLNVGSKSGVEKEMAVVSTAGVVGFIKDVSANFSTVICVMNKNFKITAKPINQDYFGTFSWRDEDNINEGTVEKFPSYVKLSIGDTMVTRTQEMLFPQGEIIGYVTNIAEEPGSNYKTIKIKTGQDFYALNKVFIIKNLLKNELDSISNLPIK
jgi:rod shape-determining protein MreC